MKPSNPTPQSFQEALALYMEASEAGQKQELATWVDRFPQWKEDWEEFLRDRSWIESIAGRITAPALPTVPPIKLCNLGDYELIDEIATGGMGVVYRARQKSLDRIVALKMIRSGALATFEDVKNFHLEAAAIANIEHSNIVPIYEVGEDQGQHYFSMKLIEGENLSKFQKGILPVEQDQQKKLAEILVLVANAVQFAHNRGFLHRDLKPENILMDTSNTPFVADFGLAQRLEPDQNNNNSGSMAGTLRYMAPEQVNGEKSLTVATDIYALGSILYEKLAGRPPFVGSNTIDLIQQIRNQKPASIATHNSKVAKDLNAICQKCLEKRPEQRYESAAAFSRDLGRFIQQEPVLARPLGTIEQLSRWMTANIKSASIIVVVAMLAGWLIGLPETKTWEGWRTIVKSEAINPDGTRTLQTMTIQKQFGPNALIVAILLSASLLVVFATRPKSKAQQISLAGAVGAVLTLSYLFTAGAASLSNRSHYQDWINGMKNQLSEIESNTTGTPALQYAKLHQTVNSAPAFLTTAFRETILYSLLYCVWAAIAVLIASRIRHEWTRTQIVRTTIVICVTLALGLVELYYPTLSRVTLLQLLGVMCCIWLFTEFSLLLNTNTGWVRVSFLSWFFLFAIAWIDIQWTKQFDLQAWIIVLATTGTISIGLLSLAEPEQVKA